MSITTFNDLQSNIADAYVTSANKSMISAANELRKDTLDADVAVSCDGTWEKTRMFLIEWSININVG